MNVERKCSKEVKRPNTVAMRLWRRGLSLEPSFSSTAASSYRLSIAHLAPAVSPDVLVTSRQSWPQMRSFCLVFHRVSWDACDSFSESGALTQLIRGRLRPELTRTAVTEAPRDHTENLLRLKIHSPLSAKICLAFDGWTFLYLPRRLDGLMYCVPTQRHMIAENCLSETLFVTPSCRVMKMLLAFEAGASRLGIPPQYCPLIDISCHIHLYQSHYSPAE